MQGAVWHKMTCLIARLGMVARWQCPLPWLTDMLKLHANTCANIYHTFNLYTWLSSHCSARGSSSLFFCFSPTKVEVGKPFPFTERCLVLKIKNTWLNFLEIQFLEVTTIKDLNLFSSLRRSKQPGLSWLKHLPASNITWPGSQTIHKIVNQRGGGHTALEINGERVVFPTFSYFPIVNRSI